MTEAEFQQDDREYERQLCHREELEREDIMSIAVTSWLAAVSRKAPRPIAALPDGMDIEGRAA